MDLYDEALLYILSSLFYASILFMIAAGLNLIYGVIKLVDLARTAFFTFGAYIFAWFFINTSSLLLSTNIVLALTIPMFLTIVFTAAIAAISKPIYSYIYRRSEEVQLLVTFGLLLVFEDVIKLVWGTIPLTTPEIYRALGSISVGEFNYPLYNIYVIITGFTTAAFMWMIIYRTRLGMLLRAMSMDSEMLEALGGDISKLLLITLILAGALSGLGGAIYIPTASAYLGLSIEILVLAFVVMIIGGLGSFIGTIIGALIVGFIRTLTLQILPELELAILYIIALAILLAKPEGLGSVWEK